jgi:hypothetical protein
MKAAASCRSPRRLRRGTEKLCGICLAMLAASKPAGNKIVTHRRQTWPYTCVAMQFHENPLSPSEKRATIRISIVDMSALRVRARESGIQPPKLLYQSLPADAMALMATIPRGTSAVSIPQQNNRYPISAAFPSTENGIVLVYARKPNSRYEAEEVLCQGKSHAVDKFCDIARLWLDNTQGGLKAISGKYAYFAPTRDQWGLVLRDGGYAVIDPSVMHFDVTPELIRSRKEPLTSGLIARIPVQTGSKSPETSFLMVFSQVELTFDPHPNPASRWISYVECLRLRSIGSRPPEAIIPKFREWMQRLTLESGFESWNFHRGMFFGDHAEWWGDGNHRRTLHEGIDFAEGYQPDLTRGSIPEGTPVRALADGEIVAILDDYLNKTVVVSHQKIRNGEGDSFFTVYSHIHPAGNTLRPVAQGQELGHVAKSRNVGAPAHLHLTGAWIPESIHPNEITMDLIHPAFMPIVLINFNSLLVVSRQWAVGSGQ